MYASLSSPASSDSLPLTYLRNSSSDLLPSFHATNDERNIDPGAFVFVALNAMNGSNHVKNEDSASFSFPAATTDEEVPESWTSLTAFHHLLKLFFRFSNNRFAVLLSSNPHL